MTTLKTVVQLLILMVCASNVSHLLAQKAGVHFALEAQVDVHDLALGGSGKAYIRNFTLSPDGMTLAVLYERGASSADGLWLALYDLKSKSIIHNIQVGSYLPPHAYVASGIKQSVLFTSDAKLLIVRDFRSVSVLDRLTLRPLYRISSSTPAFEVPMYSATDQGGTQLLIAYGTGSVFAKQFYNELLDLTSGKSIANWLSSGLIQSVSPDGKLAIAPDGNSYNAGGVTNLQVLDVHTGTKIKNIEVTYAFKNRRQNETGSVIARFLENDDVVVSPDNMVDHTGHHSGSNLEIVNITEDKLIRTVTPAKFGPTGELVVSPDHRYFAAISAYADTKTVRTERLNGDANRLEVVIGDKDHDLPIALVQNLGGYGLTSNELMPCLSSGALVLAVAQDEKIDVFHRVN